MIKKDIRFLLSLIPQNLRNRDDIPLGLSPEFYHGGSYEKEVEISKRVQEIEDFYRAE